MLARQSKHQVECPVVAIPVLLYRDVDAAVAWLGAAFGLKLQRTTADDAGSLDFAELRLEQSLIFLTKAAHADADQLLVQSDDIGGASTQTTYVVVEDADQHCARAKSHGAKIVVDVQDDTLGGRSYSCRDLEGHLWNFGTHNPLMSSAPQVRNRWPARRSVVLAGIATFLALGSLAGFAAIYAAGVEHNAANAQNRVAGAKQAKSAEATQAMVVEHVRARETLEQSVTALRAQLEGERKAKLVSEESAQVLRAQIDRNVKERALAEHSMTRARSEIDSARQALAELQVDHNRLRELFVAEQQRTRDLNASSAKGKVDLQAFEAAPIQAPVHDAKKNLATAGIDVNDEPGSDRIAELRELEGRADLVALNKYVARHGGTLEADRAAIQLRSVIATANDLSVLTRFVTTARQGPFVELAKRRALALQSQPDRSRIRRASSSPAPPEGRFSSIAS